jgi:hypothetical protein
MSRGMQRAIEKREPFEPKPNDVMVCSYLKAGTNWTMHIALQIAHRGKAEFDHIHDLVPWVEVPPRSRFSVPLTDDSVWQNSPTKLRIVKTHLPMSKLVYTPEARYIWVVRDPKDVFVSGYHFVRSIMLGPLMPSVRTWLKHNLSDKLSIGSWAEHLRGGWELRHKPNLLFLTFEEMKADLRGAVARIAELMEVDLTPDEFEDVVRQTTYEHMKSIDYKFDTNGLSPPWAAPRGAMVRRGQRGSASELLSEEEQARVDDFWRGKLEELGSDFPYDEAFATR